MNIVDIYINICCPKSLVKSGMILYYERYNSFYTVIKKRNRLIAVDFKSCAYLDLDDYGPDLERNVKRTPIKQVDRIYDTVYPYKLMDYGDLNDDEIIWKRKKE